MIDLRDISGKIYKRSGQPTDDQNRQDKDWQAGYFLGCTTENESEFDFTTEWIFRGRPESGQKLEMWRSWKAGYYSGRMNQLNHKNEKKT